MSNKIKGRTNTPNPERIKDIPSVDIADYWKDYPFVSKGSRALTTNTEKPKDDL